MLYALLPMSTKPEHSEEKVKRVSSWRSSLLTTKLEKTLPKMQVKQRKNKHLKERSTADGGETTDIVKENDPAARIPLEVLTYPGVALAAHRVSHFFVEPWL